MKMIASYGTDSAIHFNNTHFCMQMIILLKLQKCIWIKKIFPDFFQKKSNLPGFPRPSNKFPDFPDQVETPVRLDLLKRKP